MDLKIILTFALIILTFSSPVFAQSCTSLASEIRGLQSQAFDKYPLLNDVKQDILLILYGRERASCPKYVADFSIATKEFLLQFDKAYLLAVSDISEDHEKSVEIAKKLATEDIPQLDRMKENFGVEATDLVNSARQAVIDLLTTQANAYVREADTTEITKRKIDFYGAASRAFEAAGETLEATNYRIKEASLKESYDKDMQRANSFFSQAEDEYKKSAELRGGYFPSKIKSYVLARSALIKFKEAQKYYQYHHESAWEIKVENNLVEIQKQMNSLLLGLAAYFSGITVLLIIITVYLIHRIKAWNIDTYEYFLGNELVQVSQSEY